MRTTHRTNARILADEEDAGGRVAERASKPGPIPAMIPEQFAVLLEDRGDLRIESDFVGAPRGGQVGVERPDADRVACPRCGKLPVAHLADLAVVLIELDAGERTKVRKYASAHLLLKHVADPAKIVRRVPRVAVGRRSELDVQAERAFEQGEVCADRHARRLQQRADTGRVTVTLSEHRERLVLRGRKAIEQSA